MAMAAMHVGISLPSPILSPVSQLREGFYGLAAALLKMVEIAIHKAMPLNG